MSARSIAVRTCAAETVDTPTPAILPSSRSATSSSSWSSNGTSSGAAPSWASIRRRLTAVNCSIPQGAQVGLHAGAQLGGRLRGYPAAAVGTLRPHLGDDGQIVGVRMEGFADQLVRHVRAVVLRGVDVVDAEIDRPAQYPQRLVAIAWRPEHAGAG